MGNGWKTAPSGSPAPKELEQFLPDRAMEHDSPTLLFTLVRDCWGIHCGWPDR
ncbi:hypothetical protein [Microtetraspora malaysiensis]|uniref:hypothetical protein n=1 Tax=Microtetraspora malaysiensis TaxID=161358 RepID=UPI003D904174